MRMEETEFRDVNTIVEAKRIERFPKKRAKQRLKQGREISK